MYQKLDRALDAAVSENRIAGGVLLVAEGGISKYSRSVGYSHLESKRPMQITDRFRLGSITKPIMSAAFVSLFEDGKHNVHIECIKEPKIRKLWYFLL